VLGLAVRVQPIVVFPNAFVRVRPVKGVTVINKRDLTKVILGGKGVDLPFEQIVGLLKQKMGKDV
jgi:hypothetical protein